MSTIDEVTLRWLVVLASVAREDGFSAAGRKLGLSRAAVSRIIAQLEDKLGVRLFRRTTRRVVPTEAAERLVAQLEAGLPGLLAALEHAAADEQRLGGVVRVSVSEAFGRRYVIPSVARFVAAQPEVRVELQMRDPIDDLIREPIDVAIRMGPLPESSLIARRLGSVAALLVATPRLLAEHGPPSSPRELARLPAVSFRIPGTGALAPWAFELAGKIHSLVPEQAVVGTDSIEGVVELARLGCGVAFVPRFLVERELASGGLVPVLEQARFAGPQVHLCFRERELMPARVRALITHLGSELEPALAGPHGKPRRATRRAR